MPLGCSHAQSRVKLILIASTSKINISGHPTGASGIEFHYKGPEISYLLNTEEERKLIPGKNFVLKENICVVPWGYVQTLRKEGIALIFGLVILVSDLFSVFKVCLIFS